jgi:hypothetical protein
MRGISANGKQVFRAAQLKATVGVHAKASGIGAKTTIALDPISWGSVAKSAPNAKWRSMVVPQAQDNAKALSATPTATDSQEPPEHGWPMRLGWTKLLKRVFNLDLTHCPQCGGELRIVAAILQRQAIKKILNPLGLEAQPPPRAPARGQQMAF